MSAGSHTFHDGASFSCNMFSNTHAPSANSKCQTKIRLDKLYRLTVVRRAQDTAAPDTGGGGISYGTKDRDTNVPRNSTGSMSLQLLG